MNAVSIILILIGSFIGLIAFIISLWYLIRLILRFIAARFVDGSYLYDKTDFKEDGKTPIDRNLSEQNNEFDFNFDNTSLHYSVQFGQKRGLKYGVTRVRHNSEWYSSHPHQNEKKLLFQERREENSSHVKFSKLKGDSKTISIEWMLEDTSIRVITHFSLFNKCILPIKEPDLRYAPKQLTDLNFIVFSIEFPDGLSNCSTEKFVKPIVHFPRFFNDSPNRRVLSYKNRKFAPASQQLIASSGPVTLFDENTNTLVISSMDQFVTHVTRIKGENLRVS